LLESFSPLPPRITDSKPVVTVSLGSSIELACAAQAFPLPSYNWMHNTIMITTRSSFKTSLSRESNQDERMRLNGGSLRIRSVTISDAGIYRCLVNNSMGSESVETQLIVICEHSKLHLN
jgi:hypothetical protein